MDTPRSFTQQSTNVHVNCQYSCRLSVSSSNYLLLCAVSGISLTKSFLVVCWAAAPMAATRFRTMWGRSLVVISRPWQNGATTCNGSNVRQRFISKKTRFAIWNTWKASSAPSSCQFVQWKSWVSSRSCKTFVLGGRIRTRFRRSWMCNQFHQPNWSSREPTSCGRCVRNSSSRCAVVL